MAPVQLAPPRRCRRDDRGAACDPAGAEALDSTFRIIEGFLDRWTIDDLEEELRRPEWDGSWVHTRRWVIQRVFTHDVWHAAEMNESLGNAGLPQIDLWD